MSICRAEASDSQKDQTAAALAAALGDGWTVAELTEGERDYLKYAGRTLQHTGPAGSADAYSLRLDWMTNGKPAIRLEISGRWPRTASGEIKIGTREGTSEQRQRAWVTAITVDAGKPADKIAADITRRLLPDYRETYAIAIAAVEASEAYTAKTEASVQALIAAGAPGARRNGQTYTSVWLGEDSHGYSVSASGESIRFEAFSCPLAVALKVIEAVRRAPQQTEEEAEV